MSRNENPTAGLLKISEFAKLAEISRKGLIFYDNTGVFSPAYVAPNGYRYYAHEQIYQISVINLLRESGTSLEEIKMYMQNDHALGTAELLDQQSKKIGARISELQAVQDMLQVKLDCLQRGQHTSADISLRLEQQAARPLFCGDPVDELRDCISDDAWTEFYTKCKTNGVAFGYPEGFLVRQAELEAERSEVAGCILCHVGDPKYANALMPAGRYLVVCGPGSFTDTGPLYHAAFDHLRRTGLRIAGPAYEERLVDETASKEKTGQRIEVRIPVMEK